MAYAWEKRDPWNRGMCQLLFSYREKEEYKVIKETVLQLKETTTERKKRQVGNCNYVCHCPVANEDEENI